MSDIETSTIPRFFHTYHVADVAAMNALGYANIGELCMVDSTSGIYRWTGLAWEDYIIPTNPPWVYVGIAPVTKANANPNVWEDLDASGDVPAEAKALDVIVMCNGVGGNNGGLRKKGSAIQRKMGFGGIRTLFNMQVELDANRKCEMFTDAQIIFFTFYVIGYWI